MRMTSWLLSLLALMAFSTAHAGKKDKKKDAGLAAFLGDLEWGVGHDRVFEWLDKKLDAKYEARMEEITDAIEIDRLWKKKKAESKALRATYIQFGGQRSGYESSIISGEFAHNGGEAMLYVDTKESQNYYFFKNDRLWKVLVSYRSSLSRQMTFKEFVNQVRAKHGDPKEIKKNPKGGLQAVIWSDKVTQLTLDDRSVFYNSYVMKYVEKIEGVTLDAARVDSAAPLKGSDETDDLMAGIMDNGNEGSGDDDVVDRLTGQTHEIDIDGPAPKQERLVRDHEAAPKAKKPKRKTKKKKKKAAPEDPDPSGLSGGSGIVY